MKKRLIFWCLLHGLSTLFAQQVEQKAMGKITGRVLDATSAQPIEYATIGLAIQATGKVVNGTTANGNGEFEIDGVETGTYKLTLYFIGYETRELQDLQVTPGNPVLALHDLVLQSKGMELREATVTAQKSIIENKLDKMVYNVDRDVTAQTGVATDILRKVPQVSVDMDGNVSLQGNSSIRFLIDGKPSVIFGNNIADVLQSIPANQIQSIEVITSPGARYDAAGTAGIINIILKKSTAEGFNGNLAITAGTRLENGSLNLNIHHHHFGANAFLSGNGQLWSTTLNDLHRISPEEALQQTNELIQRGTNRFQRNGYQSGVGFDWDLSPMDNFSGNLGYSYYGNHYIGSNDRNFIVNDASEQVLSNTRDQASTDNYFHSYSLDAGLLYKRKFKKEDQLLECSWQAGKDQNFLHYLQSQRYPVPDSIYNGAYGDNPGNEKATEISLDYTQPLTEDARLEMGAKTTLFQTNNNSEIYELQKAPDTYAYSEAQSFSLHYQYKVYAGYASGSFKLFHWLDLKTGLRFEHTDLNAFFSNTGNVPLKSYNTYVPSGVISRNLKNNQNIRLSYNHRIDRPGYRDLSPFVNASDPKNLSTGNPAIRPEIGDKIELGYSKTFEKGLLISTNLFYRGNKDDIQSFTRYYPTYVVGDSVYTNVAVTSRENIGRENNFGLNVFVSIPAGSKLSLRSNLACVKRYILNGDLPGQNVHGFNFRFNMNAAYQLSSTFVAEFFGNFNSRYINAQGRFPANASYSLALRKQFDHKKASLALTASNPFNKYIAQHTSISGDNFVLSSVRRVPYNSFGLNFTYKFGKMEFKNDPTSDDNNPSPASGG